MPAPQFAFHGSLVASQVTVATLMAPQGDIEVVNRNASAEIFFTINGSPPVIGGNDNYIVPMAVSSYAVRYPTDSPVVVQMIAASGVAFSVLAPPAQP